MPQLAFDIDVMLGLGRDAAALTFTQISLRGVIVFVSALVIVRCGDRRFLSQKTAFDAVLGFILASMLARAVNGTAALIPETKRDSADAGRLDRWAAFKKIKRAYPQGYVGDDDENTFAAFEQALDVGNTVVSILESAKDTAAAAGEGDEIPELVEFLAQKCWTETKEPPALNAVH